MHIRRILSLAAALVAASTLQAVSQTETAPLNLRSAIRLAESTNSYINGANAAQDISQAAVEKARSAFSPTLGLESSYGYLSEETLFGPTSVWARHTVNNKVFAQKIIYSGGQLEANLSGARQGRLAAHYNFEAVKAEVYTQVAVAYYRVRQAEEAITIAQAEITSLQASFDAAQKLHAGGVVTKTDVLRAKVALSGAQDRLVQAKSGYDSAVAALRAAIGLDQNVPIALERSEEEDFGDFSSLNSDFVRPEVEASKARLGAAEEARKAAEAAKKPVVFASADFLNIPEGAEFPRKSNTLMLGVAVRFNALDGGLVKANIEEADAAVRAAESGLLSQKRQVEFEMQTSRLAVESAQSRVQTTEGQVALAEETVRVLQVGYKEGITPITDVLSAEAALASARAGRLSAVYDLKIARINVLRTSGGISAAFDEGGM